MEQSKRRTDRPVRAAMPIAALAIGALAAILVGLATLSFAARRSNDKAVLDERAGVVKAVQDQHRATAAALDRLGGTLAPETTANLGILDEAMILRAGAPDPVVHLGDRPASSPELDQRLADLTRELAAGRAERAGAMLVAEGELVDMAAQPLGGAANPAGTRPILVGLRRVEQAYLDAIASQASIQGLQLARLAGSDPRGGSLAVDDWGGFGLTWRPRRPGDALMLKWTAILVVATAAVAVLIIGRARHVAGQLHASEARAVAASNSDFLSGLPNRVFFNHMLERELETAKSRQAKLALLYFDVDHFGDINDAFGIEIGDRMIRAVTERIAAVIEEARLVARFEGDSFMILLPGVNGEADCERLASDLQAAMKPPFDLDGTEVTASASIGVAMAPSDATDPNEMIRLANLALHRAKRDGRNRLAFYKPELEAEWRRRTSAERELRSAIENRGLVLRYQPIVAAETGTLACVEALVRWQHPTEGLIAPERFIGLAEDRGLILPLGEWVLREACRAAADWPGLRVAVNVSPIQFRQPDFVTLVGQVLAETRLDPARLELELTEGVLVDFDRASVAAMAALRSRGIRLALDDFGTGYSSLIYLRHFAVDKIKIDRAFVEDLEPGRGRASGILVESMVKLGRALDLTVTAEGVETEDQRRFLREVGCHQLQGYLISKPLEAEEVPGFAGQAISCGTRESAALVK